MANLKQGIGLSQPWDWGVPRLSRALKLSSRSQYGAGLLCLRTDGDDPTVIINQERSQG